MKRATAVIGANAGDEGKGKMVDYFASQISGPKVVVRFNGGAQAGHTVCVGEMRHEFHHHGAGTLAGADTYLAKHFVCNPVIFFNEQFALKQLGIHEPTVGVDPRCYVTTPYDMLVNQAVEDMRGGKRHGSVGLGFGETIERNEFPGMRLVKADLADEKKVKRVLRMIRDNWYPQRCDALRVRPLDRADKRMSDKMLDHIADSFSAFDKSTVGAGLEFLAGKEIVFEGAQGLMLDMNNSKWFPHVTRSCTGLDNIVSIATVLNLALGVVYVTRPYITRHGAGPLEREYVPDPPIEDATNVGHPYQGNLRFAKLDPRELLERVLGDAKKYSHAEPMIAVTCVDQVRADLGSVAKYVRYTSDTPRRDSVKKATPP